MFKTPQFVWHDIFIFEATTVIDLQLKDSHAIVRDKIKDRAHV